MTDRPKERPGKLNMRIRKDRTPLIPSKNRPFQVRSYMEDDFDNRRVWSTCEKCGSKFRLSNTKNEQTVKLTIMGGPTRGKYCSWDCFTNRHAQPIYLGSLPFNLVDTIRREKLQDANWERILTARLRGPSFVGPGAIQEARKRMASRQESAKERDIRVQADPEC